MNKVVRYFAYGANRDPRMLCAILGVSKDELVGEPAILQGYNLGIMKYADLPDKILDTAPLAKSPKQMIALNWPETFESYVIVPSKNGKVSGTIWTLTPAQRERVRDWELLDFGWYDDAVGEAINSSGKKVAVVTEAIDPHKQRVDKIVDGLEYETWLLPPEELEKVAKIAKQDFDARQKKSSKN